MLWIDKYRPQTFDDIVGNKHIIQQFKNMVKKDLLRNMIITGNVGLGKTSAINCLCTEYLTNKKENLLELNMSIDRNVNDIRDTLEDFVKKKSSEKKIIILEEVDNLPESTQHAITSLMNKKVIFFLTCNGIDKLISPLQSKCLLLNFSEISNKEIMAGIEDILNKEGVYYESDALMHVVEYANHDMRFALNHVQAIVIGYGKITKQTIKNILSKSLKTLLVKYIDLCREHKIDEALEYVDDLAGMGYSQSDIFSALFYVLCKIEFKGQLDYMNMVGKYHINLLTGCRSKLQIYALTYELCLKNFTII